MRVFICDCTHVYVFDCFPAVASAIDLMLPAFVTERSLGGRNVTEHELFSKGFKTMVVRVKMALKAR